jgi:dihydroorotate dehydrogenase (NAD+) catalytic subunit
VRTRKFILENKFGGVSGPAIKPMALKAVYDISQTVKIPIIGTGGITTGEDAMEMMLAGATLVGIGAGVYFGRGNNVYKNIIKEVEEIMREEKINRIESIIGKVKS